MPAQAANITKVAYFEDGETLPSQHYLLDAQLDDLKSCSQGTFLLPSFLPKADYWQYAVALDEHTGIHHVARKGGMAIKKSSTHSSSMQQQQRSFDLSSGKPSGVSEQTVSMPVAFEGIMKKFELNTTRFGYFQDEQSSSSDNNSVSVFESIKTAMGLMPSTGIKSQDNTTGLSLPSINTIDESIIEVGRPVQQPNALLSALQPRTECSTLISETNDAAFFKSLLSKQDDAEPEVHEQMTQANANHTADKTFFESLLSQPVAVQDQCSAVSPAPLSNIKLPCEGSLTLAPKYNLLDPLDLAVHGSIANPPSTFRELDLAVTIDQASLLQDDGDDLLSGKGAGEPVDTLWASETIYCVAPVAPVGNALSYEEYFPSHSPSSTDPSTGTTTPCDNPALDSSQTSIDTTMTPKAKDDLALVLKRRPLEENDWLDLAQAFHDSSKATNNDIYIVGPSIETVQKSSTLLSSVNLPWTDRRQTCDLQINGDFPDISIASSSVEAFTPGVEHDGLFPRVHLPCAASETELSAGEQQVETKQNDLEAAIEALDLAVVFGGSANDWSDDGDLSTLESGAAAASELTPNHSSENHDRGLDRDLAELALNEADNYTPLHICRRLPAPVFKAINNEYKTLRDVYPPSNKDENDKLYEQALANVKPIFDDIPDDILHWLHEVNVEFVRTCSDRSGGGAFWDHDLPCEEMWNLALNSVEWRYFGHVLRNSEHTGLDRPTFEDARSPKACLTDLLGCDAQPQPMAEEEPKDEEDDDESTVFQHSGPKLHHINFNGDRIYDRSCTPPAVSYWAIHVAKYGRECDTSPYIKGLPAVHVKKVLDSQAFKYVDPVHRVSADNANALADVDGNELTGSRLQDAVTGEVYIVYQPYGSWLEDEYTADDDVPTQAVEGDETHQVSMNECHFFRRPYYMNPRDEQHDLLNFNGQPHLNPSIVSTLPRRHHGDSPLMQVLCPDDITPESAAEDDATIYQSSPQIAHPSPSRSMESSETCSTATTADDENESTSSSPAPNDPTASAEYQAAEASIMETAWDSWDQRETDSESDNAAEDDVVGWGACTTVVASVIPDHLPGLPNSVHETDSNGHASHIIEDTDDSRGIEENISEASTEIEDVDLLKAHQPTHYNIGSRLNTKRTRLVLRGRDFHSSYNGIGSWTADAQPTRVSPQKLITDVTAVFRSKLRPHPFFAVGTPDIVAHTMTLFPAQDSLQKAIDRIVDDLPPSPTDIADEDVDANDNRLSTSHASAPLDGEVDPPSSYLPRSKSIACQCRIRSTPSEAFPRGSIANFVVGGIYVAFLFARWMCRM